MPLRLRVTRKCDPKAQDDLRGGHPKKGTMMTSGASSLVEPGAWEDPCTIEALPHYE